MAERRILWMAVVIVGFVGLAVLFLLSLKGLVPLTYRQVDSVDEFLAFLDSPRDDMRGIKVNGHFLEIGKRRALQILPGYRGVLYQMRPYRQIQYKARNLTRAEIVDMCFTISSADLAALRGKIDGIAPVWTGTHASATIRIYRATLFTYVVTGLGAKPIYIAQVELAKRLGMSANEIIAQIVPIQEAWLQSFTKKAAPPQVPDALIAWLGVNK